MFSQSFSLKFSCLIHIDSWGFILFRHRQKRCQQTRFYAGDFGNFFTCAKFGGNVRFLTTILGSLRF